MECLSFLKVVPNLWNVDGEVTVTEQKPGEVAEELASSYERKLIEVRLAESVRLLLMLATPELSRNMPSLLKQRLIKQPMKHVLPSQTNKTQSGKTTALGKEK